MERFRCSWRRIPFLALLVITKSLVLASDVCSSSAAVAASIIAESALVDKETGRIFWEGGSSTLSESLAPRLVHAPASFVSLVLWFAIYGLVSTWLRSKMEESSVISAMEYNAFTAIPVAVLKWTLLGAPRLDTRLLATIVALYLLGRPFCACFRLSPALWRSPRPHIVDATEAFFSSTHKFLQNRAGSQDIETFIERLREEAPLVVWKVRAFHYKPSGWLHPRRLLGSLTTNLSERWNGGRARTTAKTYCPVSVYPWRQKMVHNEATGYFEYDRWFDKTTAGVWTKARAPGPARLAKIRLTKVLFLGDRKTKNEYFKQQARFVDQNKGDSLAEFSTSISINGFKSRVLVVRGSSSVRFSRRAFWICTALGLTVFYRLWLDRHCDEIRVTVTKEIVDRVNKSTRSSWFSASRSSLPKEDENKTSVFRNLMQELDLYCPQQNPVLASELPSCTAPTLDNINEPDKSREADVQAGITETRFTISSDGSSGDYTTEAVSDETGNSGVQEHSKDKDTT